MICFNCGLKLNNNDDRECRFCGVKFSGKCSSCGSPNPQTARFCFNCGNKLSKSEQTSSVENFGTLAESRKNVAVIFADVSGFTSLSEKLDPEEVREIINECFNYITSPVYELEGTIDKYIGDCVMILFGARYSHTDDAKRAVMCAMKMMDLIGDFSRSMLSSKDVSLNLSVGVNYGLVVTGGVGNYFDRDYTVMGDIVNTAQRLQVSAGEGVILVSESVYIETKDKFEFSEASQVKVKNKENSVRVYRPLRINAEYFYEKELSFIERQKEIGLLNSVYNDALNTGMKCVTVIGEAGLGKTRLLKEFTSKLGNDVKKVWVECGTVFQNRSYSLIAGVLSGVMNINPLDGGNMKQHRLISFLDYILDSCSDEEIKRNYNFLGLLMGLDRDREFQSVFGSMSFDNVKHEILKQLALFFSHLCKKQRLIVVVDDAQWADSSSLQMFNEFARLYADIKAVFVFASRYELKSLLPDNPTKYIIKLNALTKAGVKNLSCGLLNCSKLEDALSDAIIRFTKGNPLYIKELVSNIKRKGIYSIHEATASIDSGEIEILPGNIQNLIISNLSGMDEVSLKILQAASVIGKEFTFSLLDNLLDYSVSEEDVAGIPVQLNIIQLKSVHTSSRVVDKIFEFSHEIEREVIYDSILNRDKKALHKKIGEYLETRFSGEIENYYEVLCEHFNQAGMLKKASEYYYKTALKHKGSFNFSSSLEYFNRFLELAAKEVETDVDERVIHALMEMGHIHFINANYQTAMDCLDMALNNAKLPDDIYSVKMLIAEVYKDMGRLDDAMAVLGEIEPRIREDNPIYGRWLQLKCNILRTQGDPAALNLAKRSEKILLKAKDYRNLSETMKHAGMIYFIKGDIDHALFFMNKSYRYAEKNNSLEIMAKLSGDLGIIYHSTGMVSKALEFLNKSMDLSKKISYQRGIIAACINLGVLYLDKGLFDKARKLFGESMDISRETGSRLYECVSLTNLGDIAYESGNFGQALEHYQRSLELARVVNAPVEEGVDQISIVKVLLKTGRNVDISGILEVARKIFEESDEVMYLADYHIYKGLIELRSDNTKDAMDHFEKAASISTECRSDRRKLKAMRLKGRLLVETHRYDEAVCLLDEAVAAADRLESDYEAAKCWYGRYRALDTAGRAEEALESLEKARAYIGRVDRCRWTDIIMSRRKIGEWS